jgi:lactoylglutathione lyase
VRSGLTEVKQKKLVKPKFHHVSIRVRSVERSVEFYNHLFGYLEILRHTSPGQSIVHLAQDDMPVLEIIEDSQSVHLPKSTSSDVHLGFFCSDIREFISQLSQIGCEIERGPFSVSNETVLLIRDPDGYLIELNDRLRSILGT